MVDLWRFFMVIFNGDFSGWFLMVILMVIYGDLSWSVIFHGDLMGLNGLCLLVMSIYSYGKNAHWNKGFSQETGWFSYMFNYQRFKLHQHRPQIARRINNIPLYTHQSPSLCSLPVFLNQDFYRFQVLFFYAHLSFLSMFPRKYHVVLFRFWREQAPNVTV